MTKQDVTERWIAITDDKAKYALDRWDDDPSERKEVAEWVVGKLGGFAENHLPLPDAFAKLVLKILETIMENEDQT